jgi:hypothetical protein
MPIYRVQAPNGKIYKVEGPENADPNTLFSFVQQQVETDDARRLQKEYGPGVLGTFGRGVKRGAGELASTVTDIIPAAIGSALGFEDYAKEQLKEAADKRAAREAEAPTMFRSYKEVEGIGDVPRFVAETVGEQVANIGTALVPGVGFGALAGRSAATAAARGLTAQAAQRGLAGEAAEQFVARGLQAAAPQIAQSAATGQLGGVALGSYALNAPEIFQNIYENTGQLEPGAAAIFGAASAALDSVLPAKLARQLTGPARVGIVEKVLEKSGMDKGLLRSVTAGALTAAPTEGLTEGMQEAISIAAEQFVSKNPQVFGSKEWDRIMESAVRGAVAGGAFGVAGGAGEAARAGAERREAYAQALEQRGQRQLAAEVRRQGADIESIQAQEPQMQLPGFEVGPATELYAAKQIAKEEPGVPKELKGRQAELFTPEGGLTPAMEKTATRDEKMEANRQRQAAQQRAAQEKEDQAALKKALSELTDVPKDLVSLAQGPSPLEQTVRQAEAEAETLGAKRAPKTLPQTAVRGAAPLVTPQVPTTPSTVISDDVLKGLGIGPTALIRKNKLLEGKDISNPEDAAETKRILEAYAENRSQPIREKVEAYLARPEFQGVADVARPVEQPSGAGASVSGEPTAGAAPTALGPVEPSGVVPAGAVVEQPAGREVVEPVAVEAPREEAVVPAAEVAAPEAMEAPPTAPVAEAVTPVKPGKKAKKDLEKAKAGEEVAAKEQAQFINEVDQNVDDLLTSRLREAGRSAGLKDSDLPSEDYRGSEVHNFLRLPMLFAQYRDSEGMLRESAGTPQEEKNRQQMAQIEEAIATAGPDALQIFNQLRQMPPNQQARALSELNRMGLQRFDEMAQETVAKTKAEIQSQQKSTKAGQVMEASATDRWRQAATYVHDVVLKTPQAREAFKRAINAKGPLHAINSVYTVADSKTREQLKGFLTSELNLPLFLPQYEGPTFDAAQSELAQRGDVGGLLDNLIGQIKNLAIQQVLRKVRGMNLKTNLVIGPVEGGRSGSFDPATKTITLDPQNGLNAHTFIHEVIHAAISNVLANPNHPLTKEFAKFFVQIQDRLGAAYGAQDLQEFAAELVGNPSFQAVLKSIKTPRSENMFQRVMRSVAEFFGFAPKTSAFDTGLKFINDALDITGGVEATASQKMFLGMGNFPAIAQIGNAMPSLTGRTVDATKNYLSNLQGRDLKSLAFGLLRLDNINQMYGKELPSVQKLLDALEKRNGAQEQAIKTINENYKDFRKVEQKFRPQMQRMSDIAIDARLAQVDLLDPNFVPDASNAAEYARLKREYNSLPAEVQGVYRTIREGYDSSFKKYMKILDDAANRVSPSLAARLKQRFEAMKPLVGYVPFLRSGDFWVEFTDPATGEPAVHAFESLRERQQFIDSQLKNTPHRVYQNLQDVRFTGENIPPSSFIWEIISGLQQQQASQAQIDSVYQAYLTAFPADSIMKQFMKSKNRAGMERDIINGYGDVMVRWARKLANSEYVPQIDRALYQIQQEAGAQSDPTVYSAAQNIMEQAAFFHNPNFGTLVSTATTLSYVEFILGNISSALVNISSLPMMVYPLLTGKFGWGDTTAAMTAAGRTAMNDWGKGKYKNLYDTLMEHGQLEHTMAREVLEGRRQKTGDYLGIKARIMDGLSIPFAAAEKYNRGVTAIAAYDLARKNGMNEQDAIRYALDTVKTAHTSGMAATGPRWMQTPLGRIFFTFKSFVWNSAYVMARAFHQAFKGESPEIRRAAQRQLLATYGMATVFTGIKGMPFYGAISVMAQMLNALFGDDEPFDFDEFLRDIFGEFLYKGAFNYATNLEIANRAGIATDLLFRDDPRGVAEHGYVLSAMQQLFGPVGSIAVNSGRAVEMFKEGNIERAIETIAPSFVRNVMKGTRYMLEGATTLKGDPVMEDISAYNSLMQMIGFSPANLSSQYERVQAAKGFEREVLQRRTKLLQLYDMGATAGDSELLGDARDKIQDFNDRFPTYRITQDTIARSMRARAAAEKDMVYGVRFNKKLLPEIQERFLEDEE